MQNYREANIYVFKKIGENFKKTVFLQIVLLFLKTGGGGAPISKFLQ